MVGAQSILRPETIGGVEFLPYVSAAEILPSCAWTICHGGQNTIVQSLLNGVPLVIFPGPIFERRFNARRVQELGAGRMGEVNDFTAQWLQLAKFVKMVYNLRNSHFAYPPGKKWKEDERKRICPKCDRVLP